MQLLIFRVQIQFLFFPKLKTKFISLAQSFLFFLFYHVGKDTYKMLSSKGYGEGNGTPLQHSCLENPMDRGAWWAAGNGVARTQLSDFTFTFHFHALEKEMATHSSVLAWRIPGTAESGWAAIYGVAQSQTRLKRLGNSNSKG